MVDLFFYRDPDEIEKEEAEQAAEESGAVPEWDNSNWGNEAPGSWGDAGPPEVHFQF